MRCQTLSKIHAIHLVLALVVPLAVIPNCKPSEEAPHEQGPATPLSENDTCKNVVRVLATSLITREKGAPEETSIPFEVNAEAAPPEGGTVPVCVSVTSVEAKPRVLASGRFEIDGEELLGPSAFNQNTVTAAATRELGAGSHAVTARIASAPGTKVRVYVYQGSKTPPFVDAPVVGSAVVLPDKETTIAVGGGTFTFPVGAVDAPVPVTIYPVEQPYGIGDRFELLPDGLHFDKPVGVDLPYDPARIPTSTTEAELIAQNALKIKHNEEWRTTSVQAASHRLVAELEHFSHAQSDISTATTDWIPGGTLTKDPDHHVWIASFPLRHKGYDLSIEANPLNGVNPNDQTALPPPSTKWVELKQVTSHVAHISKSKIAINATPSGPLSGSLNEYGELKGGNWEDNGANWYNIGVARFAWSVASTKRPELNHRNDTKKAEWEYLIVLGHSSSDGLEAHGYFNQLPNFTSRHEEADKKMKAIADKPDGHAVMLASTVWPIGKSRKGKDDPCSPEYIPDDRNTVLAITGDLTNQIGNVLLISSIEMEHATGADICAVLKSHGTWDAILLDGGDSASIVRNNDLLNRNTSLLMSPARNVANALAVAYEPPTTAIAAPSCSAVGQPTDFTVTAAADPSGQKVTLQCANDSGTFIDMKGLDGGNIIPVKSTWSSAGPMHIYCTTFKANGQVLSQDAATIEVGEVFDVQPRIATLNQSTNFTITGKHLCSSTVAWIPDCNGATPGALTTKFESQTGDGTQTRTFSCVPGGLAGNRTGSVIKTIAGGIPYKVDGNNTFTVKFIQ